MSAFVEYLAQYLKAEVTAAMTAAPGRDLRVFFSGPPAYILNDLFNALLAEEEMLAIDGESVPVFLLDANAADPDRLRSSRCSSNHLVKVRTSGCRVFLALIPPDELTNVSIDTTVTWIGFRSSAREFVGWVEHPMVQKLTETAITRFFPHQRPNGLGTALNFALEEAWNSDEQFKDQRNTWQSLKRLFDCEVQTPDGPEAFLAILGLPKCENDELGAPEHLKVLGRIADLLENSGITPGFSMLEEQADEALRPYVAELKDHILASCLLPDQFSAAMARNYSPIVDHSRTTLPDWWRALDLDAWNRLLDSPPEPIREQGLKIEFVGTIAPEVKGLPVLFRDRVAMRVSIPEGQLPATVVLRRASGAKQLEPVGTLIVESGSPVDWEDSSIPPHDRYVRYELEAEGYKRGILKCIVLDHYPPGVAIYSRNATRITPFKLNRKVRDAQGHRIERYECEIAFHGMGSHQLDFYRGAGVALGATVSGYEVTTEHEQIVQRVINPTDEFHAVAVVETDEECYYEFSATPANASTPVTYRIWVATEEKPPTGATSEFDRLIMEHRASAVGETVNARVELTSSRATDLEIWMLESCDSYHPVVLGPDFLTSWTKPAWAERPVLSEHRLMLDPRPPIAEFQPPAELLEARRRIQNFLRPDPQEATTPIEMIQLADLMANQDFATTVAEYLRRYVAWLSSDYAAASWMDVVCIHRVEASGDALEPIPAAILLTPLHPLRLGWQCRAQEMLKHALDRHLRCPAASILDPCSFPDSLLLPCRSATGRTEHKGFLSLASSSDYWSVLWNKDSAPSFGNTGVESLFNFEFGILIEGLASGFSVQQVMRSIEEVSRLSSAKSTLQVSLESDTSGSSSCNEGIEEWCSTNLGPEGDAWFEAGPRSLQVYDYRQKLLQPEQASLASLTAKTGATVRWFTLTASAQRQLSDLSIIAHLGVSSPAFQVENLRSGIDPSGLTRHRIRKQLAATAGAFIAESRVGDVPRADDLSTLEGLILACVDKLESTCAHEFDSYVFAPKIPTLEHALRSARYCAVSSSTVDAACFFRGTDGSYLWDYELPAYSRRAGENNGYYLLAKESPSIVEAVQSAVRRIAPQARLEQAQITALLREISCRGMPTLKRLTGGGATSLGEIGMLVALRLLQSEFQVGTNASGLCPVRADRDTLNLIIAADPFKSHYDDLQTAIQQRPGERPDLVIASIRFIASRPTCLKLTAVEVKARGDVFPQAERAAALAQAASFSQFLAQVQSRANDVTIWSIAWRNLVASWLDYAFRVYGQLETFMQQEWSELHASVLHRLMSGDITTEIDPRGRLIVIDQSNSSAPLDIDCDRFNETVVLTHADGHSLLTGGNPDLLLRIRSTLGDWGLTPAVGDEVSQASRAPQPVILASTTMPSVINDAQTSTQPFPDGSSTSLQDQASSEEPTQSRTPEAQAANPVVAAATGIKFAVGTSIGAFQERQLQFFPGNTELNQLNVGIVGDLGTGKTQLVQSLLYQIRAHPENNRGCRPKILIFDYKKDYSKPQFVQATGARVVSPFSIPLNIFDTRDSIGQQNAWLERSKFFSDVLDKIFSGIGPLQRQRLKLAVRQSFERAANAGLGCPTIYDAFDEYVAVTGGQVDAPYSIISDIVDGGYFVRDSRQVQSFSDFLDGVVVVDLGAVGQDDRTKNMLVVVFLNLFYEHMLRIEKKPFLGQNPRLRFLDTMLLVDEADNVMRYEFEVLKRILLQGREFGVGVILASQYLSHFKTAHENYLEPLLTWFIHKVPNITVRELEGVGLTHVDTALVERIKTQACHECLYKTYDVQGEFIRATPFYELNRAE